MYEGTILKDFFRACARKGVMAYVATISAIKIEKTYVICKKVWVNWGFQMKSKDGRPGYDWEEFPYNKN